MNTLNGPGAVGGREILDHIFNGDHPFGHLVAARSDNFVRPWLSDHHEAIFLGVGVLQNTLANLQIHSPQWKLLLQKYKIQKEIF